jgi:uncharacterized protein
MKLSKYTYEFKINNEITALYHALLVRVVFLKFNEIAALKEFLNGNVPKCDAEKETINYLFTNYFIVRDTKEDDLLYNKCIELISPSAISNAYIVVTENCNFNCKYCFISKIVQKDAPSKTMTPEVAKKAVALLQRTYERQQSAYDKTITFYGGEPLLNINVIRTFMEEVENVKSSGQYWPHDVKYALISNAALISDEILKILRKYGIALSISYDIDKIAHSNRVSKNHEDSFKKVREKIELCKERKYPFSLSITISEDTIRNREAVIKEIIQINPATVAFNMLIPNEHGTPPASYYERATDFMIEAFKELREVGIFEDRIMRKVQAFEDGKLFLYDCCASGGNQYVIDPSGNIGICHGYLNNGKYFSDSVSNSNFDFRGNEVYRFWRNRTPLRMEQCKDCECLGICGGGCPYAADFMHGSIYEVDDRFCIHAKKVLQWMINDLYTQIVSKP